jgi:hypothetical protein
MQLNFFRLMHYFFIYWILLGSLVHSSRSRGHVFQCFFSFGIKILMFSNLFIMTIAYEILQLFCNSSLYVDPVLRFVTTSYNNMTSNCLLKIPCHATLSNISGLDSCNFRDHFHNLKLILRCLVHCWPTGINSGRWLWESLIRTGRWLWESLLYIYKMNVVKFIEGFVLRDMWDSEFFYIILVIFNLVFSCKRIF